MQIFVDEKTLSVERLNIIKVGWMFAQASK